MCLEGFEPIPHNEAQRSGFVVERTSNKVSALRSCLSGKQYAAREDDKKAPPNDDAFSYIERELIEDEINNTIQNLMNYSQPPEMFITWLVTYLDSSEARYRAM